MASEKRLIDANAMHKFVEDMVAKKEGAFANGVPYEWAYALTAVDMQPTVKAVVVPCRVGDTLYVISQMRDKRILPFINEYECTSIKLGKRKCCVYHEMDGFIKIFKEDDFGKTVFLTKEEAEVALAKMDGGI